MLQKKKVRDRSVKRGWMQGTELQSVINDEPENIDLQSLNKETILQRWYKDRIKEATGRCVECNKPINYRNQDDAFGSQAHLLPKSLFPSVATHPENCMELGRWCCHGQYDSSWRNASRMKIWPHARDVIWDVLIPLLTPQEKSKLPDIILSSQRI